jgi:hypothetical protein
MSHAEDLIRRVIECGAKVEAADGRLIVRAGAHPVPGELVERLREAKTDVLENLSPSWWRRQFVACTVNYELGGTRSHEEAARLAWGELECRWLWLYGEPLPEWQCAGCGEPIGATPCVHFQDGNRVHLQSMDCLISYGKRWRGAAAQALLAMGLESPLVSDTQGATEGWDV